MNKNFAVFILTHGRPDNVITYNTLLKSGYKGKIYIIIDNEDKTADKYKQKFGDNVIVFDKLDISKRFDECDNFNDRRSIIYARNASFEIAEKLGLDYFLQLDDDYTAFYNMIDDNNKFVHKQIKSFDKICEIFIEYLENSPFLSIAFAQGGDFIGGQDGNFMNSLNRRRKCMNSFFCSMKKKFKFIGRINEDVNTYIKLQSLGNPFMTLPHISLVQKQTQSNKGGMTDIYKTNGTYIKSFYTIMINPSSTKISDMGTTEKRLHHNILRDFAVPVMINEKYKIK